MMKTIFDQTTRDELVGRVKKLSENSTAQWGTMNAFQMLRHCTISEEMYQGKRSFKRLFIGRLFGAMALKGILKNEEPMKKNQPTHPEMKITGSGDFQKERDRWIELLEGYAAHSNHGIVHPFFGKMNKSQIGQYVYKHTDHHLRQFGL